MVIVPAMNDKMWENPAVQQTINTIRTWDNISVLEPDEGFLACGTTGKGRMPEIEVIQEAIEYALSPKTLTGKRVLITAGATQERIDPVRFLSNYSTGKMGIALAQECARRGADVEFVSGPVHVLPHHPNIHTTNVESAQQMFDAATRLYPGCQAAILCAAVADFTPDHRAEEKIKREGDELVLRLRPTQDIAQRLGEMKQPCQRLVGFALETCDEAEHAHDKLERKHLDFIVLNSLRNPGAGFQHDTNKVTIIGPRGETEYELKSKGEVAQDIVDELVKALGQ